LALRQADEIEFALATERPTLNQRRLALAVVAVLFAVFAVTVAIGLTSSFALVQVRNDAFVLVLAALLFVNDLITAGLLFGQFSVIRSRALLIIANAYLFTGFMAVIFAITFPGQFSLGGYLGAGLQTSAWVYNFWHYGFPIAMIFYAMLLGRVPKAPHRSTAFAITSSVMIVIALVCGFTWLATGGVELLPRLFIDQTHPTPFARLITSTNTVVCLIALALLYIHRRSVLDLWLTVVLCAWVSELAMLDILLYSRFTFGFYVGRGFSLITSVVVLVVLLQEMTQLYARLARSNSALQRERNDKLMNLEAMAAAIAHEVNQPLSALVTNGAIGLRLLAMPDAHRDEVRDVFQRIIDDGHRAGELIASTRAMFRQDAREKSAVNLRDLVIEALTLVRRETESQRVSVHVELPLELPRVVADRLQLQQVFVNLITNAIEAMATVQNRERSVLVSSEVHGARDVVIIVTDSGPGFDPKNIDRIFDAFFTTKSRGMGLGLAICRSIIESHGGRLWASARNPHGSTFYVQLPGAASIGE
jgi:signal transduction histidine kinase